MNLAYLNPWRADRYLLIHAPRLWLFGLPFLLPVALLVVGFAVAFAAFHSVLSFDTLHNLAQYTLPCWAGGMIASVVWVGFHVRRRSHLPTWAAHGWYTFLLTLVCLGVLNAPVYVASGLLAVKGRAMVDKYTLVKDVVWGQTMSKIGQPLSSTWITLLHADQLGTVACYRHGAKPIYISHDRLFPSKPPPGEPLQNFIAPDENRRFWQLTAAQVLEKAAADVYHLRFVIDPWNDDREYSVEMPMYDREKEKTWFEEFLTRYTKNTIADLDTASDAELADAARNAVRNCLHVAEAYGLTTPKHFVAFELRNHAVLGVPHLFLICLFLAALMLQIATASPMAIFLVLVSTIVGMVSLPTIFAGDIDGSLPPALLLLAGVFCLACAFHQARTRTRALVLYCTLTVILLTPLVPLLIIVTVTMPLDGKYQVPASAARDGYWMGMLLYMVLSPLYQWLLNRARALPS
jgi:hypothetical protein